MYQIKDADNVLKATVYTAEDAAVVVSMLGETVVSGGRN